MAKTSPICVGPLAAQPRSVTEIAPKSTFLCVHRAVYQYGFRVSTRTIRYNVSIALNYIESQFFRVFTTDISFKPFDSVFCCATIDAWEVLSLRTERNNKFFGAAVFKRTTENEL